jgi:predicted MFS family arabinose efflux permease
VATDRLGKGLRTAPRDALISLSSTKAGLATAFGVHRAMDSAGAMLGPLIAFGILLVAPARFDAVFVVSTLFAFLGLAVLVLAVQGRPGRAPGAGGEQPFGRVASGVLKDRRFRLLLLAAGGLALVSVSDALIYVGLQRRTDFDPTVFPLLYVLTAVVFMALAIPVGRLADRVGRVPVLIAGHALLLVVYAFLLTSLGTAAVFLSLIALGAYYAATDGVTTALAGAILPEGLQASGIGLLVTAIGIGQFASSLTFGALWLELGLQSAVTVFAIALLAALAIATPLLMRLREPVG